MIAGGGTIGASTGLYTAPASAGTATVQASSGGISATASVTVTPPPSIGSNPGATVTYADLSDSGKKFTGSITITDTASQAIDGWVLQFDFGTSSPSSRRRSSSATVVLNTWSKT